MAKDGAENAEAYKGYKGTALEKLKKDIIQELKFLPVPSGARGL